ncbi:hypothetical protein [Deinococcus planocerae]|uniref:hypothetical protein n=1 Tax=Deinococcus planocerae TaxID=1737569 RepID=UPI000C7F310F|nr:hypothetical protein [Deinococcus planocerae]
MPRFLLPLFPAVLLAACAPAVSSPSAPRVVSPGQEWQMTVAGQEGEPQLLVGTLQDRGQDGYDYVGEEHVVQASSVRDHFFFRRDEGAPDVLTVVRFRNARVGPVPRGCSVQNPVRLSPGESLQGLYIGGEADDQSLSIFLRPQPRDLERNVPCTLIRVR